MNAAKFQKEVLQSLLTSRTVQYAKNKDFVYVTTDGISAFCLGMKSICFNIEKCTLYDGLIEMFEILDSDKLVKPTGKIHRYESKIYIELAPNDKSFSVWINEKYFKDLGDSNLYCSGSVEAVKHVSPVTQKVDSIAMPLKYLGGKE